MSARGISACLGYAGPLLLGLSLLWACGCHEEDDRAGPGTISDPFGEGAAQAAGTSLLTLVSDVIERLPDWAEGRMGGIGGGIGEVTDPSWVDGEKAWGFTQSRVIGAYPSVESFVYSYLVRYEHGRQWQMDHEGADRMWLRIHLTQSGHTESAPGDPEPYVLDYRFSYAVNLDVKDLPGLPFGCDGAVQITGDYSLTGAGRTASVSYEATGNTEVTLQEGGCPAGTVTVLVDPYTVLGTYDGTDTLSWTMQRGITPVRSGTLAIHCAGSGR